MPRRETSTYGPLKLCVPSPFSTRMLWRSAVLHTPMIGLFVAFPPLRQLLVRHLQHERLHVVPGQGVVAASLNRHPLPRSAPYSRSNTRRSRKNGSSV